MKYWVAARETGDFIESFDTYEEAVSAISRYEDEDRANGDYAPDFYEVEDEDHNRLEAKKYTPGAYRLYETADNGQTFLVLEEKETGRYLPFDWGLSDEETEAVASKFYEQGLTQDDYNSDEWFNDDLRDVFPFCEEVQKPECDDLEIRILMADKYTRAEAVKSLSMGTEVYEDLEQLAKDFDVTVEEIREGRVEDLRIVRYAGKEYGLAIAH